MKRERRLRSHHKLITIRDRFTAISRAQGPPDGQAHGTANEPDMTIDKKSIRTGALVATSRTPGTRVDAAVIRAAVIVDGKVVVEKCVPKTSEKPLRGLAPTGKPRGRGEVHGVAR